MDLLIKHCFYIQQAAKQLYISPGQVQLWYRLTHIIPCCETGKESIQKGIDVLLCFLQENEKIGRWNCTCSWVIKCLYNKKTFKKCTYMFSYCFKNAAYDEYTIHNGQGRKHSIENVWHLFAEKDRDCYHIGYKP